MDVEGSEHLPMLTNWKCLLLMDELSQRDKPGLSPGLQGSSGC